MTSSRWVALCNEIDNVLLSWREWQVLAENGLDVLGVDDSGITFVEEFEALEGFSILSSFFESFEPVVGDDMLDKCEVNSVTLVEFWV